MKELRQVGKARAEGLDMAPELLSRKREVETFVRARRDDKNSLHNFNDWRAQLVGEDFLRVIAAQ